MNFVQLEFLWFLLIVLSAYWLLRRRVLQNLLLVAASAVFYGWIHPWFLILLYSSAVLDYFMGLSIDRWPSRKRWFLAASMVGNLGMLGMFKYFGFFVDSVTTAAYEVGIAANFDTLEIFLPVGISFYTFQTMSYTIDVARGDVRPRKDFLDYLLYVTFFAQLVAGPIERARSFLPQIERDRAFSLKNLRDGVALAMFGAFKKLVIADTLAPYVDRVFGLEDPSGPLIWSASMAFGLQILADFSGYTDLARGTAQLFGFRLIRNFDHPYLATNTPDFWRRWHMSLSHWVRDYLWVPLMGKQQHMTSLRFVGATVVAFALLGLWHGPSWNFVIFGLWNAFWMIVYPPVMARIPPRIKAMRSATALAVVFHWCIPITISMMLFRERDLARIVQHLGQNPFDASLHQWVATTVVVAVTLAFASPLFIALAAEKTFLPRLRTTPWYLPLQTTMWSAFVVALFVFYRLTAEDFIYFQF